MLSARATAPAPLYRRGCGRRGASHRAASVVAVAEPASSTGMNKYSSRITQPKSQGASQAMLYATGLKEEDMSKAQARCRRKEASAATHQPPALCQSARPGGRRAREGVAAGADVEAAAF